MLRRSEVAREFRSPMPVKPSKRKLTHHRMRTDFETAEGDFEISAMDCSEASS